MIKQKYSFVGVVILATLLSYISFAQTPDIKNEELHFGVRNDAYPVSAPDEEGYCTRFLNDFGNYLKQKYKHNLEIKTHKMTLDDRYQGRVKNTRLDGECGANTKNEYSQMIINPKAHYDFLKKIDSNYQVPFHKYLEKIDKKYHENRGKFSDSFAITGSKLLIKNKNFEKFYKPHPFENDKIGYIQVTTTSSFICVKFGRPKPENKDLSKKCYKSQDNELKSQNYQTDYHPILPSEVEPKKIYKMLKDGEIIAFVSDEILLKGILEKIPFPDRINYSIVPKFLSLSYEEYGIVIYDVEQDDQGNSGKNTELLKDINNFINKNKINEYLVPDNFPIGNFPNNLIAILYHIYYLYDTLILTLIALFISFFTVRLAYFLIKLFFPLLIKNTPDKIVKVIWMKIHDLKKQLLQSSNRQDIQNLIGKIEKIEEIIYSSAKPSVQEYIKNVINIDINIEATAESKSMSEGSTRESNFNFQNPQFAGGLVNADTVIAHKIGGSITNYTPEQRQNLAEAAAEIQQLLYQLSQINPTTDEAITEAIHQEIKRNPTLKARLQAALKAGGLEALKAIFNHPLFSIPAETIKGWLEAE